MTRIFGHDAHFQSFAKAMASGRLHHGWILAGPRGVGKAGFAQEAARMLFGLEARPTDKALRAMAEAWSPWRSVAARILWAYYRVAKEREGVI